MKIGYHRLGKMLVVCILLLAIVQPAATRAAPETPAAPALDDLLNPDGTLRLDGSFSGALALEGWQVQLDPARGPVFAPAADPQWNAVGSVPDGALGSTVYALAVSGTDVVVGGWFTNAAGIAEADYVAKWNGSAWSALGSNGSGNGALGDYVYALAVSGTDVYVGGWFTNAAGIPEADYVAKWNGSAWSALGSNGSGNGALGNYVFAIAVSGTDVVVGGAFTNAANSATIDYVGRWGYPVGATCTAVAGDWSNPATWSCGYVPGLGDKVVIPAGFTVTLDADITLDSDLEVQGTLDPNGKTITLAGNKPQTLKGSPPGMTFYNLVINKTNKTDTVTVDGKLKVTKKLTITKGKLKSASDYEDIEIGAGGELELTSDITVGGNFTILPDGTFTPNGFRTTFDGAKTQNVTLSEYADFEKVTVAAGTVLVEVDPSDSFYVTVDLVNNGVITEFLAFCARIQLVRY